MELLTRLRRLSLTRAVPLPEGARVVGVGALLRGGAGRTPLAIALARALPGCVFVGHGYGGSARTPHRVLPDDPVGLVGDEARIAARALDVPVLVGPRAETLAVAARLGRVIVVDRLLQTRPRRLACSILVAGTPPSARVRALVDLVVHPGGPDLAERVWLEGTVPPRVALITSMASSARAVASLARLGVATLGHVRRRDHASFSDRERRALDRAARRDGLEAWIVDAKTAALLDGRPLAVPFVELRQSLVPSPGWLARVRAFVGDPG